MEGIYREGGGNLFSEGEGDLFSQGEGDLFSVGGGDLFSGRRGFIQPGRRGFIQWWMEWIYLAPSLNKSPPPSLNKSPPSSKPLGQNSLNNPVQSIIQNSSCGFASLSANHGLPAGRVPAGLI